MKHKDVVHIYNGIFLNRKKRGKKAVCHNMDGLVDYHIKVKEVRQRKIYDIIYM